MGSGATSAYRQKVACDEPTSAAYPETFQSRSDEELRWLRKTFETEKSEKEWLMKRYEHMEQELSDRGKEIADLRTQLANAQLANAQRPLEPAAVEVRAAPRALSLSAEALQGSEVPAPLLAMGRSPTSKGTPPMQLERGSLASPTGLDSPMDWSRQMSPGSGLRERRNKMTLGVVTAKPAADVAENAVVPVKEVKPVLEVKPQVERVSKRLEFLQSLNNNPCELIEPMTDKSYRVKTWHGQGSSGRMEPMSPLLGRRTGWSSEGKGINPTGVQVQPAKLLQMPDLVPCSPKRVPTRSQQMSRWSSSPEGGVGCETIGEGNEAEMASPKQS